MYFIVDMIKSAQYDIRGSHILVNQYFPYIPRISETESIVDLMKSRQSKNRKGPFWPVDKACNDLIVVSGTAGKNCVCVILIMVSLYIALL